MRMVALTAVLVLLFTATAFACPASYVHGLGQNNNGSAQYQKASQVADGYMTNRGVNPNSPAGQVVRPYVIGTGLVEFQYNKRNFDPNWSVDKLTQTALGPNAGTDLQPNNDRDNNGHGFGTPHWHYNLHAGYGLMKAGGSQPPQVTTDKKGG